jgi:sugar/nucleoside kinase (ribokinase family)
VRDNVEQPPELVCVGRIVQEMIHLPHETKGPVLGSPPAYCSVAAARQGTTTGIVTRIGPDISQDLLKPIMDAGVDTRGILIGGRTTASVLIYDEKGNKEIHYPSMSDTIKPDDIPKIYHGCGIIYICSMNADIGIEDLIQTVAIGKKSAVDLGGYGGAHMSKTSRQEIQDLSDFALKVSEHFAIVKASDEDARIIFGENNPDGSSKRLLIGKTEVVIITLGSKGALVRTAKDVWHVPPTPSNVVDTTGGGDVFMAGFLSEYLRNKDPLKSARWGCATAAFVIEQSGGVRVERMPTSHQIQALLEHKD